MREWVRAVHRARDLLGMPGEDMPPEDPAVRGVIYESWRRSRLLGLEPDTVTPGYCPDVELDTYLTRVVAPLVERRRGDLDTTTCALSLTDEDGRLLRRWVSDASFAARLDSLDVAPQFSVAESHVGTTGALSLLSGEPVLVRGPEHFGEVFHSLSCAGAPIVHPVSRKVVGCLDLTCRLDDATPFVLAWVTELAADVQQALHDSTSRNAQLLLSSYLAHGRDARQPVVTLDRNTIISNAAAARLIGGMDQAVLWEHASRAIGERATTARSVVLADGTRVSIETRPVGDGPDVVGAVLKIKQESAREPSRHDAWTVAPLPGLVGHSARWSALCAQAALVRTADRLLVVGEEGSGRAAVARATARPGPVRFLDGAQAATSGDERWLHDVEDELDGPDGILVLQNVDLLPAPAALRTSTSCRHRQHSRPLWHSDAGRPADGCSPPPRSGRSRRIAATRSSRRSPTSSRSRRCVTGWTTSPSCSPRSPPGPWERGQWCAGCPTPSRR